MSRLTTFAGVFMIPLCFPVFGQLYAREDNSAGRQEREGIFEFAAMPGVTVAGAEYTISFASKGRCDATVAIVDGQGRVVRHLASGVLGANAPLPLQPGTLVQNLRWDGRDDSGKPAPAGCSVSVGLGLNAKQEQIFGWYPRADGAAGIAVDDQGCLYLVRGGLNSKGVHIQVYDRDGRYLRTIMPNSGNATPESAVASIWVQALSGSPVIARGKGGGATFDRYTGRWSESVPWQSPAVLPDKRLVMVTGQLQQKGGGRQLLVVGTADGALPAGSILNADRSPAEGIRTLGREMVFAAGAPDGRWVYLSAPPGVSRKQRPSAHAVFRVSPVAQSEAERFAGEPGVQGRDELHLNDPRGVACDADGNVYVADYGNDRIQVFKPDGSFIRSVALDKVIQIAVHPKSRDLYALCATAAGKGFLVRLIKLKDGRQSAVYEMPESPGRAGRPDVLMALDGSAPVPSLWVLKGESILKLEERDGKFEKVLDRWPPPPRGWEKWWIGQSCYITADPYREELYVRQNGGITDGSPVLRVDGRTGKVIDVLNAPVENIRVGPDRLVYMRLMFWGKARFLAKYDPDAKKYLSWPENRTFCPDALKPKTDIPLGPCLPFGGARRQFNDQTDVAPNGDIYTLAGPSAGQVAELMSSGGGRPAVGGYMLGLPEARKVMETAGLTTGSVKEVSSRLLQVFSRDGKLKALNALPGLRSAFEDASNMDVRVGKSGAVYLAAQCRPVNQKVPDGIAGSAEQQYGFGSGWGTVIKFGSAFDKFPVGRLAGGWEKLQGAPTHQFAMDTGSCVRAEGMLWDYGGIYPVPDDGGCTCLGSSFDLDGFERVFLPAATCTVNVLDANGNVIVRLGRYGNCDSTGPEPGFLFPRFVTVSDEAVYVMDHENERIVRCRLAYKAEATVTVP